MSSKRLRYAKTVWWMDSFSLKGLKFVFFAGMFLSEFACEVVLC